jgi:hypothetical protein
MFKNVNRKIDIDTQKNRNYLIIKLPENKIIPREAVVITKAHDNTEIASNLDLPTG